MASLSGVFEALGRLYTTGGRVGVGAGATAGKFGLGVMSTAEGIGNTLLQRTTWKEAGSRMSILPYKLKKGLGASAFIGMSAVGIGKGVTGIGMENTQEILEDRNVPMRRLPGQVQPYRSPYEIDDMGAGGDLVLSLNNNR